MGIIGTVTRKTDVHFVHANIDIDVLMTEEVRAPSDDRCCDHSTPHSRPSAM